MMRRFDIHIHSDYSDGANSVEEIIEYARGIGLDGIAITDHNTIQGSLKALEFGSENFRIIPGIEISAREGHIIGLGIKEGVGRDLLAKETIDRIHGLGGLAIAAHPYDVFRSGVGDLIYKLDFDAVEVYNGHTLSTKKSPEDISRKLEVPVVGVSDVHRLDEVGMVSIVVGEDPIDAIRSGKVMVEDNTRRVRIIKNYLKKKTGLF